MVHQITRFSDAQAAWENWHLSAFELRRQCVDAMKAVLLEFAPKLVNVVDFHIKNSENCLANIAMMPGATGETNEFYTEGRGVTLIILDDDAPTVIPVFAMLTCALLGGNTVMVCSNNPELAPLLHSVGSSTAFPESVLQLDSLDSYHALLDSDVRCVGFVGRISAEKKINRELSKHRGPIVNLVAETDLEKMPVSKDTTLPLRFVTERTRTINITAIGGNASLLELGSDAH